MKKKPFTAEDIFLYKTVGDIHCAHDAQLVACEIGAVDRDKDGYTSAIWVMTPEGGEPRQMTSGFARDTVPRWSHDGERLAFLSDRAGGAPQIQVMPRAGGEARQLAQFDGGVNDIEWSPQDDRLLANVTVKFDSALRGERPPEGHPVPAPDAPQLVWRLPYKMDGVGFILDRELHLFVVDASSGECVRLTDGAFDVNSASWSPDGKRIAFSRTDGGEQAHRSSVWVIDADGTHARRLTTEQSQAMHPKWSPDGRWIVFSGAIEEGDAQARLWLIDVASGRVTPMGDESIEVSSESDGVHWTEDSSHVMATVARRGRLSVVEVAVPGGRIRPKLEGERHLAKLAFTRDWWVYSVERPTQPVEVFAARRDDGRELQLTHLNDWWNERAQPHWALRQFEVPDGDGGTERIEGWLITPADSTPRPVPLLLDVHGGPASFVLLEYPSTAYWPLLWSRGWAILALNAVGSSSYGREFAARLRGRWGELDLAQHLAAAKTLQDEGLVDGRLAMAGKSYGGYLTAWAIGQTPLLSAAVVTAPVSNIETHYGVSDGGYYADPYSMCGERTTNRELMRRLSPANHVEKACTPTLILQGELDERCPRCQGEELFVTMRRNCEAPCELVVYPGGSHSFLGSGKPSHRVDAIGRIAGWLSRWIGSPRPPESGRGASSSGRRGSVEGHGAEANSPIHASAGCSNS